MIFYLQSWFGKYTKTLKSCESKTLFCGSATIITAEIICLSTNYFYMRIKCKIPMGTETQGPFRSLQRFKQSLTKKIWN